MYVLLVHKTIEYGKEKILGYLLGEDNSNKFLTTLDGKKFYIIEKSIDLSEYNNGDKIRDKSIKGKNYWYEIIKSDDLYSLEEFIKDDNQKDIIKQYKSYFV